MKIRENFNNNLTFDSLHFYDKTQQECDSRDMDEMRGMQVRLKNRRKKKKKRKNSAGGRVGKQSWSRVSQSILPKDVSPPFTPTALPSIVEI